MRLPEILAGPIVRRSTVDEVNVWVATSVPLPDPELLLFDAASLSALPLEPSHRTVALGRNLFVHVLAARPVNDLFPSDEPIAYDVLGAAGRRLDAMTDLEAIRLPRHPLPTFVLQSPGAGRLHALYGSCRKMHGPEPDMMRAAERILMWQPHGRPEVLFLGGDQIYADDVDGRLLPHITALGNDLMGKVELVPGIPPAVQQPGVDRGEFLKSCFTSTEMHNHLLTFGEWAATYLLAWNPELWMRGTRVPDEGSRAARRVMANTVTYMCFDDHEITDDWFLNAAWKAKLDERRWPNTVILNGLCAYWAFQGWGNDPHRYGDDFSKAVTDHIGDRGSAWATYAMLKRDGWSYLAPTSPPTLVLDTRTAREASLDHKDVRPPGRTRERSPVYLKYGLEPEPVRTVRNVDAPRLLNSRMRAVVHGLVDKAENPATLIVVAPSPIFGFRPIEEFQETLGGWSPPAGDLESWAANPRNLADFVRLVVSRDVRLAVVLSGDVHYGFEMAATVATSDSTVHVAQLCSSALKNHPQPMSIERTGAKFLRMLGERARKVAWWDFGRGGEDGPITRHYAAPGRVWGNLVRDHGKPTFVVNERLHDRAGFDVILINNLGDVTIDDAGVDHRFWYHDGVRIVSTELTSWRTDAWPAKRIWID